MHTTIAEFYKGKKVFLTGHTGFKGSWLLCWFHSLGAEVKGYALPPLNDNDIFNRVNGAHICDSVFADIRDPDKLRAEILSFEPDIIFHLAAQPLVLYSYKEPELTFDTNVMGTAHLLSAVRSLSKRCAVILITTDKVYENREWDYPYREVDRLGGYDPYSASKAACEILINSYSRSFFHPDNIDTHLKGIAIARAGNVIGGGDYSKDRIIPDIVYALNIQATVQVRNPLAVRPWQHVLEPLGAYLILGMKLYQDPLEYGGPWNFGPYAADTLPVIELVKKAILIWGEGKFESVNNRQQEHEAGLLKLDISKAMTRLKWKPLLNSDEAIERTINWYKKSAFEDAMELILSDIQFYTNRMNNA